MGFGFGFGFGLALGLGLGLGLGHRIGGKDDTKEKIAVGRSQCEKRAG